MKFGKMSEEQYQSLVKDLMRLIFFYANLLDQTIGQDNRIRIEQDWMKTLERKE